MKSTITTQGIKPLSEDLFTDLEHEILSGNIPSGSKITEQSICKKYGVSRTPVREAFRQLESIGLIDNIPNRGAFVLGLTNRDISDLFDLRKLLEIQAIKWAIERIDENSVEKLYENIEFMEFYTIKNDIEKVLQFNSSFHNIIYKSTDNRLMCQSLYAYQTYLKYSAPPKSISGDYLKIILNEHKAIYEAIENKNIIAGQKAMELHIENSKLRRMSKYF